MTRLAAILLCLCLGAPAPLVLGQDGTGTKGEEKSPEEVLKAKVLEIIATVKATYASEFPTEQWNAIREKAEKDLIALGPKAIPILLPYMDSAKLKEILGKTDTEFASRVKGVLMKLGWISPEMKAALKELMGKLAKGKIVPKEDSPRFMELGDYAVKALDAELRKDPKQLIREKILEILGYMGNVGILSAVSPLLYAVSDPEPAVRLQALLALAKTAEDDKNFKHLDAMLVKAGAYQVLANHVSGDEDPRVRLRAATVLGWMEVREAASLLMKAMDDKAESVGSESVWALQMISRVEVKEGESWSRQVENLKAWWAKKSKTLPKQLKPAKPFIRAKKKGTKKGK